MTFRGSLAPLAYPVGGWPSRAPVVRESRPPEAPRPRLLDRVREAIRARHGKRHPAEMGAPEVTKFLTSLAVDRHVAASTQNQALSALLFLYKDVLAVDLPWLDGVVRAKRPARLPVVLTRDEVRAVLQLVVRGAKGDKDRVTMLPAMARLGLVGHLEDARAPHEADLAMGAGWVELPTALLRKYPNVLNRGPAGVRSPADRMFAP